MDHSTAVWMALLEYLVKLIAPIGALIAVCIAAANYRSQTRLKQADWLKSLFEKFYENSTYKEVRVWLDYDHLHGRLTVADAGLREMNEEKFTDFLNFFEFIGVLYSRKYLSFEQVYDVFDYYLERIKADADCREWINRYGFEKLKMLLERVS